MFLLGSVLVTGVSWLWKLGRLFAIRSLLVLTQWMYTMGGRLRTTLFAWIANNAGLSLFQGPLRLIVHCYYYLPLPR